MAATLTDFVQQKYDGYVELIEQLKAELSKIRDEQKQTYARYENTLKEAMELDKAIAATRQEMSNSNNMPADIETLAEQLRQQLIERRHLAASLADLAQSVKFVDKNVSVEESLLVELTSTTSLWETDLEDATGLQQHQDNWVSSETEDAISAVRDIATALLAETPITVEEGETDPAVILSSATLRIQTDIPETLLNRARARASLQDEKIAAFESYDNTLTSEYLDHIASSSGSDGVVTQRWSEYQVANSHLRSYALKSVGRYQHAINQLGSVVNSQELTAAEIERINSLVLEPDSDELTTEQVLHEARDAVLVQQLEIELAVVAALKADVNADPSSDTDVQAAKDHLVTLSAELVAAESAHTAEFASNIDLWESAIPDPIWANLYAYDSSIEILTEISTSDSAALVAALSSAEDALVAALSSDDDDSKLNTVLTALSSRASVQAEYLSSVQTSISLSAMRGDY